MKILLYWSANWPLDFLGIYTWNLLFYLAKELLVQYCYPWEVAQDGVRSQHMVYV